MSLSKRHTVQYTQSNCGKIRTRPDGDLPPRPYSFRELKTNTNALKSSNVVRLLLRLADSRTLEDRNQVRRMFAIRHACCTLGARRANLSWGRLSTRSTARTSSSAGRRRHSTMMRVRLPLMRMLDSWGRALKSCRSSLLRSKLGSRCCSSHTLAASSRLRLPMTSFRTGTRLASWMRQRRRTRMKRGRPMVRWCWLQTRSTMGPMASHWSLQMGRSRQRAKPRSMSHCWRRSRRSSIVPSWRQMQPSLMRC